MKTTIDNIVESVLEKYPTASALVLVGSYARGEAHSLSDIDLICLVENGPNYRLYNVNSQLISVQCKTETEVMHEFNSPHVVSQAIPSWRNAQILYDPHHIARKIKEKSYAWSWDNIEHDLHQWAAETVIGYAEEIFKILAAMKHNDLTKIKVQASLIGIYLTPIYATINHILYESENNLWSGKLLDPIWHNKLNQIFNESSINSGLAAISMFLFIIDRIHPWMNQEQKQITELLTTKIDEIQ